MPITGKYSFKEKRDIIKVTLPTYGKSASEIDVQGIITFYFLFL
jgi:hypothetical protein